MYKQKCLFCHRLYIFSGATTSSTTSKMTHYDRNKWCSDNHLIESRMLPAMQNYVTNLQSSPDSKFFDVLKESIELIDSTIEKYRPNRWCIAFNGGKDCTALLHLLIYCLYKKYGQNIGQHVRAFYFQSGKAFKAVDDFVEETKLRYNIEIANLYGNVKDACCKLKTDHPEIEAVFMGTRRCDLIYQNHQNGAQSDSVADYCPAMVAETDPDWPTFTRIYPLLKWDYGRIWNFLTNLRVPYCRLYNEGYTSLGDYGETVKNPALQFHDDAGNVQYKPAYELRDFSLERACRVIKKAS